ncbi:hypothetical protein G3578_19455 [Brevibacillus sp. SYP-B805]|uniref:hypothetical protein n=1 Tax=Brevibacillus sp. SYP-B805 TaxID=1578199 RepID=UPI0013ED0FAC|nr:hypothetical protein [Brevibacillus sp. SYP-B805]NGQ97318.1 hypothetical protein [Brevibacillus sp. SYP-B805]
MRVFIISFRQLIVGIIVVLVLVIAGIVLLVSDPLDVTDSYRPETDSIATTAPVQTDLENGVKPELALDVTVDGSTADVKMITQHFQFVPYNDDLADHLKHGTGHAHVYLDGQLKGKVYEPEFLLKKLPKGEHELRVELAYSNHLPYKVEAVKKIQVK